jgi:hypothetical protein
MTTDVKETETRSFEADVARLLHMMVHSVYSDRDVFLRELTSNGAVDVQLGRGDGDTDGGCTKGQGDRERPRPVSHFSISLSGFTSALARAAELSTQ